MTQSDPAYWSGLKGFVSDIMATDPDATPNEYRPCLNRWHAKMTPFGVAPWDEFCALFGVHPMPLDDTQAYRNRPARVAAAVAAEAFPAPWEDGHDPNLVPPPVIEWPPTPRGPATADELAEIHFREMMADPPEPGVPGERVEGPPVRHLPDPKVRAAVRRSVPSRVVSPDDPLYRYCLRRLAKLLRRLDPTVDPFAYLNVVDVWHTLTGRTGPSPRAEFARLFGIGRAGRE